MIRIRRNNKTADTTNVDATAAKRKGPKVAYTTEEIADMVRTRAYYLYCERQNTNCACATDHTHDWLTAETLVRNELGLK
ncbi:MAG: hypothetical protein ABH859_07880 [Pseudomonadota bacterium]